MEQDLIVDTGADRTTVPSGGAATDKGGEGQATLFLNKPITVDYGRVAQMQIGDLTLRNPTVFYAEQDLLDYPVSLSMNLFRGYVCCWTSAERRCTSAHCRKRRRRSHESRAAHGRDVATGTQKRPDARRVPLGPRPASRTARACAAPMPLR